MTDQPNKGEGTWTAELVMRMCELMRDNPRVVARELGEALGVSRNAVLGKLLRLRRAGMSVPKLVWGPGANRPPKPRKRKRTSARMAPRPRPAPPPRPLPDLVGRYTLLELEPHHCRWPFGEDRILFCGETASPGVPYCIIHARIAYNRPH